MSDHGSAPHTGTYLDRIVPAVRRRLEQRREVIPLARLMEMVPVEEPPSFAEAIAAPGVSLIAEIKRASPSKGPIRADLEVAPLARAYERAGARAISVLTEEDFFMGSPADLRAARGGTSLPLLRKDFILDAYQVYEARAAGASAVLLIAALLDDEAVSSLLDVARGLSLDVLLEVHDEAECVRALEFPDVVIGVNNRDLRTFEVSLRTAVDLARLVPSDRLLVGESGIGTSADVRMLVEAGVDGILVGESLLRSPDVEVAICELIEGSVTGPALNDRPAKEDR